MLLGSAWRSGALSALGASRRWLVTASAPALSARGKKPARTAAQVAGEDTSLPFHLQKTRWHWRRTHPEIVAKEALQQGGLAKTIIVDHQIPEVGQVPFEPHFRRVGLVGVKCGMIPQYDQFGTCYPCTVVKVNDCVTVGVNWNPDNLGLVGLQVAEGDRKPHRVKHSMMKQLDKHGIGPKHRIREFRVSHQSVMPAGTPITVRHFRAGQFVDVQGTTKGKGFQGVMKRWGFAGQPASHGVSKTHRSLGSTGMCQDPGRVFKGKKMPGRMGGKTRTVQSLVVFRIDPVNNLLYLRGQVPGPPGTVLAISDAIKKMKQFENDPPPFPTFVAPENDDMQETFAPPPKRDPHDIDLRISGPR